MSIDTEIIMAGEVAERRHFAPGQMGMPLFNFVRQLFAGLPDHGQPIGQGIIGPIDIQDSQACEVLIHRDLC